MGTVTYFISYVLSHSQIYFNKIGDCPHFSPEERMQKSRFRVIVADIHSRLVMAGPVFVVKIV